MARFLLFFCWIALLPVQAWEHRYWVWHRAEPLTAFECDLLRAQGVTRLYWHVVSLRSAAGVWAADAELRVPRQPTGAPALVPVFRLLAGKENALSEEAARDLARKMAATAQWLHADEVQIDFDCPDRLLPEYASFLRVCRENLRPVRLSATALGSWGRPSVLALLQGSVDALYPMFYDLQADAPAQVRAGVFVPALDKDQVTRQFAQWKACQVPWYAGLPGFARISIFTESGTSRGHLRKWDWGEVACAPQLSTIAGSQPGLVRLLVQQPLVLAETPLAKGEIALCRWPQAEKMLFQFMRTPTPGTDLICVESYLREMLAAR